MIFGSKKQISESKVMVLHGRTLDNVNSFKFLGVHLKPNFNCSQHIKHIKTVALAASYKLSSLGINTTIITAELKSFLINVYCRTALQYGIENSFLNEKDYKELTSMESKIIKRSLNLTKYHSTTLIINALDIKTFDYAIKIRKLSFMQQLLANEFTRRIVNKQLENPSKLANKSLIRELVKITKTNNHDLNPKP